MPRGCELCLLGAKSVVLITGLCPLSCFYCPVGADRLGRDVIYVNDVPASGDDDIVRVVRDYASEGAAITGGEPAAVADRVWRVARFLKREFGVDFHIHTYVHVLNLNDRRAGLIASSDVDEVRVHAVSAEQVRGRERYVRALSAAGKAVWVEVPALPGRGRQIAEAVSALAPYVDFVNINELDVSESNVKRLAEMGYRVASARVPGSLEAARRIAGMVEGVPVHICTARAKDVLQVGSRNFRHAMTVARPNEYVQDGGVIVYDEGAATRGAPQRGGCA
jgi:pyruvate formate-lyase activating enzyme-like uncharacterized protein